MREPNVKRLEGYVEHRIRRFQHRVQAFLWLLEMQGEECSEDYTTAKRLHTEIPQYIGRVQFSDPTVAIRLEEEYHRFIYEIVRND